MPSIKDLKKRIVSTKNTQQTTKAMKMVSAAKLRRAQEAILAQRPYAKGIQKLIGSLATAIPEGFEHPVLRKTASEKPNLLLVLVTSDRGLCGGFNGNVIKSAQRWMMANGARYGSIRLGFIGKRGYDYFRWYKTHDVTLHAEIGGKVYFPKARAAAEWCLDEFTSGRVDEVKVIYNEFKNAITQLIVVEDFLPLAGVSAGASEDARLPLDSLVKPDASTVLGKLLERTFAIQMFRILLESQASEHGARMSAMENATKNAGEMIRKLTLQYNKQRQASITKELLEIISGSESQKQA